MLIWLGQCILKCVAKTEFNMKKQVFLKYKTWQKYITDVLLLLLLVIISESFICPFYFGPQNVSLPILLTSGKSFYN